MPHARPQRRTSFASAASNSAHAGGHAPAPRGYSVAEVASQLLVSVRTVRRLVANGRLQHVKIGRRVVVTAASVAALLEQAG